MSNIAQILNEELQKPKPDKVVAGCLMLDMANKISNWKDVIKIIDPADIYDDEVHDYGIEKEPHITILFGFDKNILASEIEKHFDNINQNIKFKLIGIGCFLGGERKPYDVIKFDIESEDLQTLHEHGKDLPHTLTNPDYHPHMTIAYVRAGTGERYIKKFSEPMEMDGNTLLYSIGATSKSRKSKTKWKIKKKYKYPIELNDNSEK